MKSDRSIILAYMAANNHVLSASNDHQQVPLTTLNTLLGVFIWGEDANTREPNSLEYIADKLAISPQTISEHLRYLGDVYRQNPRKVGMRLVETAPYALNRRMKTARLTPKGKAVINSVVEIIGAAA